MPPLASLVNLPHEQTAAAVHLVDYLKSSGAWPESTRFTREGFRSWLADSHTEHGYSAMLNGFDALVTQPSHIVRDKTGYAMTPWFASILRENITEWPER